MTNITTVEQLLDALRDPDTGCPWSRAQTFESLLAFTIEEVYEVIDAVESGHAEHICDELADLLLHIAFYAKVAEERGLFNFADVERTCIEKQVRRKPHLQGETIAEPDQALNNWQQAKALEHAEQASVLDGVAANLPGLLHALKLQQRAAEIGFDWPAVEPIFTKIDEELAELKEAIASGKQKEIQAEMGDVLFTCVNLARALQVNPEQALRQSNQKFSARFRLVEQLAKEQRLNLKNMDLQQLDDLWDQAKQTLSRSYK